MTVSNTTQKKHAPITTQIILLLVIDYTTPAQMSSPLRKETMSPSCGEKRPLPEDDNDEEVPAARRRRPSAVLKESMESAVSNNNSTDATQEEGSENETFKVRKYLPKKSAIVWTEYEVRKFKRSRCVCHYVRPWRDSMIRTTRLMNTSLLL